MWSYFLCALLAYLVGSISFAIVVSYFFGLDDPRSYGSKNPGATNVLRTGKKLAAALTLFGDALKGWVDLEFEGGTRLRVSAGESIYIPGGLRHNEIATSDDFEILEVSVPADMGTQPCDPPR